MNDKQQHLKAVTDVLIKSTEAIHRIYFQIPVAGKETPQYRERVYCYELYHQMRTIWPDIPYLITGELDKSGHPWIYHGSLDYSKPDFTIHSPGIMRDNLLVIEVKPPTANEEQIIQDLRKLTDYHKTADYFAAFYLVYGFNDADAQEFASCCQALSKAHQNIDLNRIRLFNHARPGHAASEIGWLH